MNVWEKAQDWEADWWGSCINTYGEEEKQLLYADRMGLRFFHNRKSPYNIDMNGQSVLDLGGGPVSLLLKCVNVSGLVADPILRHIPEWVMARYDQAGVQVSALPAEEFELNIGNLDPFDEIWVYNVLQHVQNPAVVIASARSLGKLIRIFEWIDTPANIGHPHTLTEEKLNEWLRGEGKVENLAGQANCVGRCYYGIFPT